MKRVLIATFSFWQNGERTPLNGMIEPLVSFFGQRAFQIDLIDGTHPGSSTVLTYFDRYSGIQRTLRQTSVVSRVLQLWLQTKNSSVTQTQPIFKLRDFFSVFEYVIRSRGKYELFIGLECVYTLAGIILKYVGIIKTVVYYVSDYSPKRYDNGIMNGIYTYLDKFCCYHADFIWDLSPAMLPARIAAGLSRERCKPVIVVHNGLFLSQIHFISAKHVKPLTLVFAGSLGYENGPELAIHALQYVKKRYPNVKLHFYGGPKKREQELQRYAKKLNVQRHVLFHGLYTDTTKLAAEIKHFMIGLAPYRDVPGTLRRYADASKIRLYLGCGLPVVTTDVPPLGKELVTKNAGIIRKDTAEAFADGILQLCAHPRLYNRMKKSAFLFAKNTTWNRVYSKTLTKMKLNGWSDSF